MGRVKLLLRIVGIFVMVSGVLCLPVGYGVNPKRDLSVFSNLADMGLVIKFGLVLVAVGAVMLVASRLLPGEEPEDLL